MKATRRPGVAGATGRPWMVTLSGVLAWCVAGVYLLAGIYLVLVVRNEVPQAGRAVLASAIPALGCGLLTGLGAWGLLRGSLLGRLWLSVLLLGLSTQSLTTGNPTTLVLCGLTLAVVVPVWAAGGARRWFAERNPGYPGGVAGIATTLRHVPTLILAGEGGGA